MSKKSKRKDREPTQSTQAAARPGRPQGSTTTTDTATGELTRCRNCHSTERGPYLSRTERAIAGIDGDGRPYTHIIWRRCRCAACGQYRIDRHRENRKHPA